MTSDGSSDKKGTPLTLRPKKEVLERLARVAEEARRSPRMVAVKVPHIEGSRFPEGKVNEVWVAPGQVVTKEKAVIDLEGETVDVEVATPAAGVVREVLVQKGDIVKPGDVVAWIETGGEERKP